MILDKITIILENRKTRTILEGLIVGKIIEITCTHYIKTHPEMFKDYIDKHPQLIPKKLTQRTYTNIRGGQIEATVIFDMVKKARKFPLVKRVMQSKLFKKVVKSDLFKKAVVTGKDGGVKLASAAVAIVVSGIIEDDFLIRKVTQGINLLLSGMYDSQPSVLWDDGNLKKYKLPLLSLDDFYSVVCNEEFQFLFDNILKNIDISYETKLSKSESIFHATLSSILKPSEKNFLGCCIASILQRLSKEKSRTGFLVVFDMLTNAIRDGKIPYEIGVLVAEKLKKNKITLSPEFKQILANLKNSNSVESSLASITDVPRGGCTKTKVLVTIPRKKRFHRIRKKLKNIRVGPLISDKGSLTIGLVIQILLVLNLNEKVDSYLGTGRDSIPNVERQVSQDNSSILDSQLQSEENLEKISKAEKSEKAEKERISQADIDKEMQKQQLGDEDKPASVKPKASRKCRVKHTRAKMATLQDLEPLKEEDFPDIVEPNNRNQRSIREGRIRNK